ncbi:MAG: DUF817 domain-containing protein [Alphaproteobacteria bacterium]|nr:DUF817 domain-containing protein [Alphaproteobacteria bacterium]
MKSSASLWPPIARFIDVERRVGRWAQRRGALAAGLYEFVRFGMKQAWACLFGGLLLGLILVTKLVYPDDAPLARYDFLFLAAVTLQVLLLRFRLETWDEARAILLFHLVGTMMELFKTSVGSWVYPEDAIFRIAGVPLFSGFMYATVGSYLSRVWRLFDFRFTFHPPLWSLALLAAGIYLNFFAHHYMPDMRLGLFAVTALLFLRCFVYFKVWHEHRRMPLLVGFFLVALFIWFAENIATAGGAWVYPHQRQGWVMVPLSKLSSWYLLMIVSYTMVAFVNRPQPMARRVADAAAVRAA